MISGLLLLAGCPKPIPDHLRLDPADVATTPPIPITDLPSAVAAIVGKDPLARSPFLPDANALDQVAGADPLAAFVRQIKTLEGGSGQVESALQSLEEEWRGTAVVPLTRGYRLRIVENELANGSPDGEAVQLKLTSLLTPLSPGIADPGLARPPLSWLGDDVAAPTGLTGATAGPSGPVRAYAERWVLESWLGGPDLPVSVLAGPLGAPQYDDLRGSPIGRVLMARVRGDHADEEAPLADLRRATTLAVVRAAADRDAEQDAWKTQKDALAAELGDPDPIGKLLEGAAAGLTAGSGSDRAAGGALLSLAALRWVGRCPGGPGSSCAGLDRVETMRAAARWDPEIASLAAAWTAVALKESLDALEVGHDTAMYARDAVDLVDALVGTDAGPIEAQVVRKSRPDPQVWLSLSRSVGEDGSTDWDGARVSLGRYLAKVAEAASGLTPPTETVRKAALDKIRSRAVP